MVSRRFLYTTAIITGIASYLLGCGDRNSELNPVSSEETQPVKYELPYNPDARFLEKFLGLSRLAESIQDTLDAVVNININGDTRFTARLSEGITPTDTVTINLHDPNFRPITPQEIEEMTEYFE